MQLHIFILFSMLHIIIDYNTNYVFADRGIQEEPFYIDKYNK